MSAWAEAAFVAALSGYRGGDRSDFPRRPSNARQVEALVDGLDVHEARAALRLLAVSAGLPALSVAEALFHALGHAMGAPVVVDSELTATWAAVEARTR